MGGDRSCWRRRNGSVSHRDWREQKGVHAGVTEAGAEASSSPSLGRQKVVVPFSETVTT